MTHHKTNLVVRASLKAGVAILPLAMILGATPAWAQSTDAQQALPATPDQSRDAKADKDIVVTGTSIRGIATVGTNELSVSQEDIKASGANSASQVLATIPQIGTTGGVGNFFNAIPQVGGPNATAAAGNNQQTQRPTLRPVPGGSGDSGNSTLILIDGFRASGAGVNSNSASPDSVPPMLLERVELDTDGSSAIYGSDAVAGVINYILKRRFDGVQVAAHIGESPYGYSTWDASGIVGKDWGSGSAYISYSHAYSSPVYNRDVPYYLPIDFTTGYERDLNCNVPNIRVSSPTPLHYYASNAAAYNATTEFTVVAPLLGTPNVCRTGRDATIAQAAKRDNVFGSIAEDVGPFKFTLRGHYNYNATFATLQPATYTGTVNNTNPYFRPLTGADAGVTSYSVLGNFGSVFGPQSNFSTTSGKNYGGTFEADYDISSRWQIRATADYDMSDSNYVIAELTAANLNNGFDTAASSTCAVSPSTTNCLNPFNIGASNPALLATINTSERLGVGHDRLLDLKAVADGPLFALWGNDIRLAFGVEYLHDQFTRGNFNGLIANVNNPVTGLITPTATTSDIAGFAEINIPLVTQDNAMPLVRDLRISASGRYDAYKQFGGTFNPRIGADWKPFDWLKFRGSWNTSFRAPSAIDILGEGFANSTIAAFPAIITNGTAPIFLNPAVTVPPNIASSAVVLSLQGTDPNLKPQTSDGYSLAVEFTPIKHLFMSVDFYRNDYKNQFGNPCQGVPCFPLLPQYETVLYLASGNGTPAGVQRSDAQALVNAFALLGVGGAAAVAANPLNTIYGISDGRKTNLGNSYISGIDYQIRYTLPTGFGSVFGLVSGNIQLTSRTQTAPGTPFLDNYVLIPQPRDTLVAQLGMTTGGFRGTLTLNHSDGFNVVRTATLLQSRVNAFNVFNLSLIYDFKETDIVRKGLEFTLVVNNIANTPPPLLQQTGGTGYPNSPVNKSTLGRVVLAGFQKKF